MANQVTAAQVVPQNVEKIPLYHWRPGARLLAVGSRDGAQFSPPEAADNQSFQRPMSEALLTASQERLHTDGFAAAWEVSLQETAGLELLTQVARATDSSLVVVSSGFAAGEISAQPDAYVLLIGHQPGPDLAGLMQSEAHVEVVVGCSANFHPGHASWRVLDDLPWAEVVAVHVVAERMADLVDPTWIGGVRDWLASLNLSAVPMVYGEKDQHTRCSGCGEVLIWRTNGRSRIDEALDTHTGQCCHCQTLLRGTFVAS